MNTLDDFGRVQPPIVGVFEGMSSMGMQKLDIHIFYLKRFVILKVMSLQSGRALIKTIVIRAFLKTYEIMFIGNRNKNYGGG